MIKQLCKNCWQNVILHQICCAQGQVLPLRDSAHFVRPRVCSANYPIIDFFWQDFVLQRIVRVRIPFLLSSKKTGHSFCYALFFMAESKGLGSLRSPASLLRKLSYYRLLLTRLRLAKDCKGSNPLLSYQQKNKGYSKRYTLYSWRRVRDSNPRSR